MLSWACKANYQWNNFLKTGSETYVVIRDVCLSAARRVVYRSRTTTERLRCLTSRSLVIYPFLTRLRFWKGVGKRVFKGRKEPGGKMKEVVETPPRLLSESSSFGRALSDNEDVGSVARGLAEIMPRI